MHWFVPLVNYVAGLVTALKQLFTKLFKRFQKAPRSLFLEPDFDKLDQGKLDLLIGALYPVGTPLCLI